jgi:tRNA A37 threonylcarbamoyladenosine dehydratase
MRKELKKRGVKKLKVVYSRELPLKARSGEGTGRLAAEEMNTEENPAQAVASRRSIPGSVAFVPSVAGLIIAGEVVKDLIH